MACYTPKFLWNKFEGGLMRMIVMGLNITICTREEKEAKRDALLDYLIKHVKVSEGPVLTTLIPRLIELRYSIIAPQAVRHSVLGLRISLLHQHYRADVSDESLLRWRVPLVRHQYHEAFGCAAGAKGGSHGLCVPPGDQVHLPQVWSLWFAAEARLTLHPAAEHCEREDVRVHLVLVLDPARPAHRTDSVPVSFESLQISKSEYIVFYSLFFIYLLQWLHYLYAEIPTPPPERQQSHDSDGDLSLAVPQTGHR